MVTAKAVPQSHLIPKLVTVLREGYSVRQFLRDLMAGLTVGIVALPLAIAFGIASGVNPAQGLYTAVVAGFVISLLSGSRVQIGGPTGAFIVVVHGIVQQHGYPGLAVATLLAGVLLLLMGFARLGTVIQFVPYPVVVGFTTGIALIIAVSQLPDFLGIPAEGMASSLPGRIAGCWQHRNESHAATAALAVFTVVLVALWPRWTRRIPGSLVAIVLTTALVKLLDLPVETIGGRFGAIPTSLPLPSVPAISLEQLRTLFPAAFTIALLAAIESLLCAVVADGMIGGRHRPNMELIAQGAANLLSPLFQGIPATGAIARTATNVKSGGRTPIAGLIHAATLFLIMTLFGRWAEWIPICSLAGILMVVAYNMSEWRECVRLLRSPRSDVLVLLVTFLLTVFIDLTVALEVGVVLAALLFMRRMGEISGAGVVTHLFSERDDTQDPLAIGRRDVPAGVEVFEIHGPLFFGAARKFHSALATLHLLPRILILRLREVSVIDATGIRALEDLLARTGKEGTVLLLSGIHAQPLFALERAGLIARIGREHTFEDVDAALEHARQLLRDEGPA